jgi:hypothetical protein
MIKKFEKCLLYLILAVAMIEVFFLSKKNYTISNELKNIEIVYANNTEKMEVQSDDKEVGKFFNEINFTDSSDCVVFFFSASCSTCDLICNKWNNYFIKNINKIRMIGVTYSTENEIKNYRDRNNALFDIVKITKEYRFLTSNPQTIYIKSVKILEDVTERELERLSNV